MKTKPKNAFEVARDAQIALDRGIHSRKELHETLVTYFECIDKIDALGLHITQLASLSSKLSKAAADYAARNPEAMDSPLKSVKDRFSQGALTFGGRVYTLTETRNDRTTRLWSVRSAR